MPPFANPPTSGRPREVRARRVDGVDGAVERPDVHRVPDHRRWGLTLRGQVDPPVASPVVLVERVQFAALGDGVDDAGLVREGRENLAEKVARPLDRAGRGVQTAHVPVAADEHRLAVQSSVGVTYEPTSIAVVHRLSPSAEPIACTRWWPLAR
jgi:hypothetical protein